MSHPYNILIVEDTLELARFTKITLERAGMSSRHAIDGQMAVDMALAERPDLIILDLNLPGMSGWQVLDEIGNAYGVNTIPIIVTTAYSDGANRLVGKLQSVYKYLIKPFKPQELIDTVRSALETSTSQ